MLLVKPVYGQLDAPRRWYTWRQSVDCGILDFVNIYLIPAPSLSTRRTMKTPTNLVFLDLQFLAMIVFVE